MWQPIQQLLDLNDKTKKWLALFAVILFAVLNIYQFTNNQVEIAKERERYLDEKFVREEKYKRQVENLRNRLNRINKDINIISKKLDKIYLEVNKDE